MDLELRRKWAVGDATIGELDVDDQPECFTVEDVVRAPGVKVPGETAIPAGRYRIIVDRSDRFSRLASAKAGHAVDVVLPRLLEVPGFTGIRIHAGNTAKDTDGCLLVNQVWVVGKAAAQHSREALERLQPKLEAAIARGEEVWILVRNLFDNSAQQAQAA
jgi:hypothetical protein